VLSGLSDETATLEAHCDPSFHAQAGPLKTVISCPGMTSDFINAVVVFLLQGKSYYVLFDVNLSAGRAQEWLTYLVDGRFFHRQTKEISIELLTFNGP
jgi:hypothetical protein